MSFREKSAWLMCAVLIVGTAVYAFLWLRLSAATGTLLPPVWPITFIFAIVVFVLAIGGRIIIALLAPKEANAAEDERDRLVRMRAGNIAGRVFLFGTSISIILYLVMRNGDVLFYALYASFIFRQLVEYALQAVYYRGAI